MDYSLAVLPVTAFVTSALTGVVGMGGGLMLLVVMAEFLPFTALIPVHGINQFITHGSRALISARVIDYRLTLAFGAGAIAGAGIGSQFVLSISEATFKVLLGLFVLACLFQPKRILEIKFRGKWSIIGAVSSFCGMFVGATGIIIAPFYLGEKFDKETLVATKAACQVFIHGTKVLAFLVLGFVIWPYLLLIVLMAVASFTGSYSSKKLLSRISEKHFNLLFKFVIIALAVRLVIVGLLQQ